MVKRVIRKRGTNLTKETNKKHQKNNKKTPARLNNSKIKEKMDTKINITADDYKELAMQYDEQAKKILSYKSILAFILSKTVNELKEMPAKEIEKLIEDDIYISKIPVDPGQTNKKSGERITGMNTENAETNEGLIRYDILFKVKTSKEMKESYAIIINIEMQKEETRKYNLINRAIYYICRLISSQKQREFVKMNFDDITKVYSIWIVANMKSDSVNRIHLTQDTLYGKFKLNCDSDLINIVIVGITGQSLITNNTITQDNTITQGNIQKQDNGTSQDNVKNQKRTIFNNREISPNNEKIQENIKEQDTIKSKELCRMLNTLFSNELGKKERLIKLENEFDISIDNDLKEEVEEMCNLGQGILERGEARGRQEGIREGRQEGIREGRREGRQEGIREGRREGRRKGRQEAREEMAIEMYKEGMSIKIIAKITKASENDIEQILINNGVK
mgnify:CR=1 FL=1